ncbi:alpha/beta fold hydrolase [Kitasatospora sp. NPDC098652]|uniref:alpha/beta fold hydrolase n=1 Tax=Kitasatospora sp. NPDC098652 TaxID=3364095 RepID=UPI0038217EEE
MGRATGAPHCQACWSHTAPGCTPSPVLLLGGDRDIATPYELLYEQAQLAHDPEIVIVPGAAHSVQNRAADPVGRQAVHDFLLRQPEQREPPAYPSGGEPGTVGTLVTGRSRARARAAVTGAR